MSVFKVKLRKSDLLFTKIIRIKYDFTCQKCGRMYIPGVNMANLGVSHYFNRRHEATRFDEENVTLLCNLPCHQKWEHEKGEDGEYTKYMIERLGQKGFDLLNLRAHTYKKRDDKLMEMYLKEQLREFDGNLDI